MFSKLAKIGTAVSNMVGRTGLKIEDKKPEIYLAIGIISGIGALVTASVAVLHAEEVLDRHKEEMNLIEEAVQKDKEYAESCLVQQDKVKVFARTGLRFAKMYALPAALEGISLTCIIKSHNILNARYVGAISAYNAVREAFGDYRKRVIEEEGEDADFHYRYGTDRGTIVTSNPDGTEDIENVDYITSDNFKPGDGAVIFDESCKAWDPDPQFNLSFLRSQENFFTDILRTRGHVFLNEVYERLQMDHTQLGGIVGWIKKSDSDYVSFGIDDYIKRRDVRRFINGQDNCVLLNFNHNGNILKRLK